MYIFNCKQFDIRQVDEVFKITTDATLLGALTCLGLEDRKLRILEIGTGTGIVALMLAQRFPFANIEAIDINPKAVEIAQVNFQESSFSSRLKVSCHDIMQYDASPYDLIVTNPPYFLHDSRSKNITQEQARHQDSFTYNDLLQKMCDLLVDTGCICMIHPQRYEEMVDTADSRLSTTRKVYFRHTNKSPVRNMISELRKMTFCEEEQIYFNLRNEDRSFSKEYVNAMRDFLTIF